ncbi:hypothetical protein [Stenotrophomonas sp. Marseille-Q5258]|uniref:hypothetical protein n=1 Tax=Stenotrophomonas sp. Marseille-Q5258 TaxID=2972779 RepID=UPI0021CA6B27|nr:hypothetical protein [Stenotrophomonas sp. Marseille-Q5258]
MRDEPLFDRRPARWPAALFVLALLGCALVFLMAPSSLGGVRFGICAVLAVLAVALLAPARRGWRAAWARLSATTQRRVRLAIALTCATSLAASQVVGFVLPRYLAGPSEPTHSPGGVSALMVLGLLAVLTAPSAWRTVYRALHRGRPTPEQQPFFRASAVQLGGLFGLAVLCVRLLPPAAVQLEQGGSTLWQIAAGALNVQAWLSHWTLLFLLLTAIGWALDRWRRAPAPTAGMP